MNSAEVKVKFIGDTKDVDSKTKNLKDNLGGLTGKIVKANITTKVIGGTFRVLSSNLDGAITRFDTLNQFPKVMKNLGISSKDAEETIQLLSDSLTGLPTSLDQATGSVQRLTSKNGNVKKSAKYFLAMNNAILAGGGNAQTQASAIEQLSQAYAKGKPDMMEWRTIMTAMPAQMKQVAIAMGYVDATALGEALRKGEVSMDSFMDTMVQLNEKGVGEFASFEQQARDATGGISTSITNLKTAVVRGIANIITSIDKGLESVGGISGVVKGATKVIDKLFKLVNKYLPPIIDTLIDVGKWLVDVAKKLEPFKPLIVGIVAAILTYKTVVMAVKLATTLWTMAQMALNTVLGLCPIILIISLLVGLVAIIIYLWNTSENFRNFIIGAFNAIKAGFLTVYNHIKSKILLIMGYINMLKETFKKIGQAIKDVFNGIKETFKKIKDYIEEKVEEIKKKFDWFDDFVNIGKDLIEGIKKGVKSAWNGAKDWFGKQANSIKNVFKFAFGIHSPSKVFADEIGKNMVLGIEVGYSKELPNLQKMINSSFNLSPTLTGTANTHLSPNVNVVVNNNMKTDPLGQVVNRVKTFSGGAKNDYNYGYGG